MDMMLKKRVYEDPINALPKMVGNNITLLVDLSYFID